jgi:EmrB/QacA subfamily drug resistance transporter
MTINSSSNSLNAPVKPKSLLFPLLAIIAGMIMVIIDSTVVNVAMPKFVEDFHKSLSYMQWAITAYTLSMAAVIPLSGWLSDRFGAKRIFLVSIVLFVVGSILCSTSQSAIQLIIYRICQGLGGGMVAPIGMAMVFRLAPREKMGSLMGMLGVPMLLGPALGPILSGYFVEYVSWHWIFLIHGPIGIIAISLGLKFLPSFEKKGVPALDKLGMILAPIAFATLAYGVNQGGKDWSSSNTIISLTIGGIALIIFIFVELRQKQPLLELRVFGSSDFTRGIVVAWILQIALFGAILLVPLYLQSAKGYSPLNTGLYMLPQALASGLMFPIGGRLYDRLGARPSALTGLAIIASALFMLSKININTELSYIMLCLGMLGGGMGLSMMSINTHILQAAPKNLVTRVTPLTTAAQQVMVSFAVAGITSYLTSNITGQMKHLGKGGNPLTAVTAAFGETFFLSASIACVGFALCLILRRPKHKGEEEEVKTEVDPTMVLSH